MRVGDNPRISVALVDDEDEARTILGRLIGREPDLELVHTGATGREALRIASRVRPDVLVLDVMMPDLSGIDAAERIAAAYPGIGLILLTGHESVDLVKRALRAGVKEFLSKPIGGAELAAAIRRVDAARDRAAPAPGLPTTWAFLGAKGTCGTTTLAVNVACALARGEGAVALVDADLLAGDCAFQLDLVPSPRTFADLLTHAAPLDRGFVQAHLRRWTSPDRAVALDVLESPVRYFEMPFAEARCRETLDVLSSTHRHVVVDLPPNHLYDPQVAVALDLADELVLVSNADLPSLKSLAVVLRTLIDSAFPLSKVRVLVNELVWQGDLDAHAWIRERFGALKGIADVPVDREACTLAIAGGLPVVLGAKDSQLAGFMMQLADGPATGEVSRTRWFDRIWDRLRLRPA
jgi:pilus assembly protein CpaE